VIDSRGLRSSLRVRNTVGSNLSGISASDPVNSLLRLARCGFAGCGYIPAPFAFGSITANVNIGHDRFLSLAAMLLGCFVPLLGLSTGDTEPLHFVDQRCAQQTEPGGCAFWATDDPVGFGQCLEDVFALGIL
jgi:hypothetical protein